MRPCAARVDYIDLVPLSAHRVSQPFNRTRTHTIKKIKKTHCDIAPHLVKRRQLLDLRCVWRPVLFCVIIHTKCCWCRLTTAPTKTPFEFRFCDQGVNPHLIDLIYNSVINELNPAVPVPVGLDLISAPYNCLAWWLAGLHFAPYALYDLNILTQYTLTWVMRPMWCMVLNILTQ